MLDLYAEGPPSILADPLDTKAEIFATAVLHCSATSYSHMTITWKKVGTQTLPFTAILKTIEMPNNVTSILTITSMAITSFGLYYCVAKNSVGETHSEFSNLLIKRKLLYVTYVHNF